MRRKERTRVLVEGRREVLSRIAREAEGACEVRVVEDPAEELVMLKVREGAQRSLFYLGEALMTSCTVRVGDAYGYGMVLGEDRDKARDLAVVDAAYAHDEALGERLGWDELLAREAACLDVELRRRREALLKTQVDFSTMEA